MYLTKRHHLLLFGILAAFVMFQACRKSQFEDIEFAEHNAEFAFPLFNTNLLLQDLIENVLNDSLQGDTLVINPDNSITLSYAGDVSEKKASDIFRFFENGIVPIYDTSYNAPLQAPDSVSIRRAELKSGFITIALTNAGPDPLTGVFRIPQLSKNGVPFSTPFSLPANLTSPDTIGIDLTGFTLKSSNNTLTFIYEAYNPMGMRVKLPEPAPGFPGAAIIFANLQFSYLEGYWGNVQYDLTRDTIEIDINQTDLDGNVYVEDPRVTFTVVNSYGFQTRGLIKYLSFIGQNGEELELTSTLFNNDSIDFNYPSLSQVGEFAYTNITLDKSNSNIAQIFNSQPIRLIYELVGIANADKNPNLIGFLTDSSVVRLRAKVEFELEGRARNFGADQVVALNFGDYTEIDTSKIENVEFKIVSENEMPITAGVQVYFLRSDSTVIDSLFLNGPRDILQGAPVDNNGNVTGNKHTETFVDMTIQRFNEVRRATLARLRVAFTTSNNGDQNVNLLAGQNTLLKMGVKVRTRYQ